MAVGDRRDPAKLRGPRNLLEKAKGTRDVGLDLAALIVVEVALSDRQEAKLGRREHRSIPAVDVAEGALVETLQLLEVALGGDRRFVCRFDRAEEMLQLRAARLELLLERRDDLVVTVLPVAHQVVEARALELELGALE